MDQEIRDLIHYIQTRYPELYEELREVIEQLLAGLGEPDPERRLRLLALARAILNMINHARGVPRELYKLLALLIRALTPGGAAEAAAGTEAAAGATATGFFTAEAFGVTGLAALGLALAAAIAIFASGYHIGNTLHRRYGMPPMQQAGPACKGTPDMGLQDRGPITGRSIGGGMDAWDNTMEKAAKVCDSLASNCTGSCTAGHKCKPNVSVQTWTPHSYVLFSSVDLTFRCPCECLP